jgi:hypothetical protein
MGGMNGMGGMPMDDVPPLLLAQDVQRTALLGVRREIQDIQQVLMRNIDNVMARSERIELLVDRAESLSGGTVDFRRQAQAFQDMMWHRKRRTILMLGLIVFFILFYWLLKPTEI